MLFSKFPKIAALTSLSLLSGCASPGVDGLKANGIHQQLVMNGDPKKLASCVADRFDSEPNGLGAIAMPAEGWREPSEGVVQIFNSNYTSVTAAPGSYAYFATFTELSNGRTAVDLYASRNVHIALPSSYVSDWFMRHLENCVST